jgi:hypothetical protein
LQTLQDKRRRVEKPFTERFFSVQAITYCEMYSLAVMDEKIGKAFSKKHS